MLFFRWWAEGAAQNDIAFTEIAVILSLKKVRVQKERNITWFLIILEANELQEGIIEEVEEEEDGFS